MDEYPIQSITFKKYFLLLFQNTLSHVPLKSF